MHSAASGAQGEGDNATGEIAVRVTINGQHQARVGAVRVPRVAVGVFHQPIQRRDGGRHAGERDGVGFESGSHYVCRFGVIVCCMGAVVRRDLLLCARWKQRQ